MKYFNFTFGGEPVKGAGDLAAVVAQPIAKAADAVLGTKIAECGGCKNRRDRWNRVLPLKQIDEKPKVT